MIANLIVAGIVILLGIRCIIEGVRHESNRVGAFICATIQFVLAIVNLLAHIWL